MNRIVTEIIAAGIAGFSIITGCKHTVPVEEESGHSIIPVTVSHVRSGPMNTYIDLSATSEFLLKAVINAPATGYIDKIMLTRGDIVEKGDLLFKIKTKEAFALTGDTLNSLKFSGIVEVKASTSGIITSILHTEGDFVSESEQLCEVAVQGSFAFILDVPFELSGTIKLNTPCQIALPDSQIIRGIIRSRLPSIAGNSQTERFIVRLFQSKSLPENLTGKIRIVKESVKEALSLPKSAILTNETMINFWVMKMINDSMAVKVPVTPGISEGDFVQITRPSFSHSDLFLTSGNYGVNDTVFIKVLNAVGDGS